jgi:threonine aldolase
MSQTPPIFIITRTPGFGKTSVATAHRKELKIMRTIDLRSDTVTLPTPEMRRAMAEAPVGDDVFGEDPTINRLEALAAERVGKQAALLVASGTMGNLCALLTHCARGDEAIVGDESHIYHYEAGGPTVLGGVALHTIPTLPNGELPLAALAGAIRDPEDIHEALTRLICLENTHNRCGGVVLSPEYMRAVHHFAHERELLVHLDGARLFNAAVALRVDARELTRHVDTVQFCLSKGLAAPVGSILAGDAEFITRARRARKLVGGGMRQAGIIAAAGIVALEQMVERLAEDHANARMLAEGLATFPRIEIDPAGVQTDIVIFKLRDGAPDAFERALAARGLLVGGIGYGRIRAVTHYGIDAGDIEEALEIVRAVLDAAG